MNVRKTSVSSDSVCLQLAFLGAPSVGKATLIKAPLRYNIIPGSKEQKLFNKIHKHLAFDLRNVPHSYQSALTDVYSLGYNFKSIGKFESIAEISKIANKMITEKPTQDMICKIVL